ncbi:sugar efflux transporter [Jeongeupia naejangsanensis]|uniref:Sugar efflux transporter n=1 Tax=Jeongeupia naejangsanensis TaxID=613195 RepID=A0ABS2BIJ7_9NEIS|nr:sugar efflux transporter [Jeongeupia naejangsanensis]MBM3114786.1 sugar efflux transporter [Jeongeupia naejangsanensis]
MRQPDKAKVLLLVSIFLMGVGSAFFAPLQSFYFVRELGVAPSMVGTYLALTGFTAIVVSHQFALYSDKGASRKKLLIFSSACGVVTFGCFLVFRNVYVLAVVGFTLVSCISIGAPQLFALAGETYKNGNETLMGSMRAMVSMAWVIGPPLSFALVSAFGFVATFSSLVMTYVLICLISLNLNEPERQTTPSTSPSEQTNNHNAGFKLCCAVIGMALLNAAINNYLIMMPLYLVQTEGKPDWLPGVFFGITAACEIPLMMLSGKISKKMSHQLQLVVAACLGTLYYAIFVSTSNMIALAGIQIIGATCIALSATAGLQYFQSLARDRIGFASTLYSNSIAGGMALGAFAGGLIASSRGYTIALQANIVLCALALSCFLLSAGRRSTAPLKPVQA